MKKERTTDTSLETTKPTLLPMELSVGELVARRDKIKEVMAKVMEEDAHGQVACVQGITS